MSLRDAVILVGWAMTLVGACLAFEWVGLAAAGILTVLIGLFALEAK